MKFNNRPFYTLSAHAALLTSRETNLISTNSPVELEFKMDVRARSEIFIGIAHKYHSN